MGGTRVTTTAGIGAATTEATAASTMIGTGVAIATSRHAKQARR
jgi:hypothetical protein